MLLLLCALLGSLMTYMFGEALRLAGAVWRRKDEGPGGEYPSFLLTSSLVLANLTEGEAMPEHIPTRSEILLFVQNLKHPTFTLTGRAGDVLGARLSWDGC